MGKLTEMVHKYPHKLRPSFPRESGNPRSNSIFGGISSPPGLRIRIISKFVDHSDPFSCCPDKKAGAEDKRAERKLKGFPFLISAKRRGGKGTPGLKYWKPASRKRNHRLFWQGACFFARPRAGILLRRRSYGVITISI